MSESQLVSAFLARLWHEKSWISVDRANAGTKVFKDNSGKKQFIRGKRAGTPDIEGYFAPQGRYIGLEVKLPGNKQQDSQIAFEADVKAKGGHYFLVHSPEELEVIIKELKPC